MATVSQSERAKHGKCKVFSAVEINPDGSRFVRHTGSWRMCWRVFNELIRAGYNADIEPARRA